MTMFKFTVPGPPKALGRKRVFVSGGRPVFYPEKKDAQFRDRVAYGAREAGVEIMSGPIGVELELYLPRPKRLMRKRDPEEKLWCITRPDADNFLKAIFDALTGIAWRDDAQICEGTYKKYYHEKTGSPRTEITIRELRPR